MFYSYHYLSVNLIFINIRIEFITGVVNMVRNTAEATRCPRLQGESLVALLKCMHSSCLIKMCVYGCQFALLFVTEASLGSKK